MKNPRPGQACPGRGLVQLLAGPDTTLLFVLAAAVGGVATVGQTGWAGRPHNPFWRSIMVRKPRETPQPNSTHDDGEFTFPFGANADPVASRDEPETAPAPPSRLPPRGPVAGRVPVSTPPPPTDPGPTSTSGPESEARPELATAVEAQQPDTPEETVESEAASPGRQDAPDPFDPSTYKVTQTLA